MTELAFLLDLLLEHKLSAPTRKAITERIKFVEAKLSQGHTTTVVRPAPMAVPAVLPPHMVGQSPSTIQAMLRHEANGHAGPPVLQELNGSSMVPAPPMADPQPVAVVAQTPAAMAAMNQRQAVVAQAISGKPMAGETKPRKW